MAERSVVRPWRRASGEQAEPRPASIVLGDETEAVDYVAGAGELWRSVPGALAWLES